MEPCRYLLEPLVELGKQAGPGGMPTVLMLLDALDEADYDNQGWAPVTRLIALR